MPARVLVIGLDAAEATLLERGMVEGRLPGLAAIASRGATIRLDNPLETLPGAIWPELHDGVSCGQRALYYHPRQLRTGEAALRVVEGDELDLDRTFWNVASDAGRRVAVVDIPQTVETPGFNGIFVREWGLHDRTFDVASQPPELIEELRSSYGDHPVPSCDDHGRRRRQYHDLRSRLLRGAASKTALLLDLLGRESWDLFACAYGETHCVGHQFWHATDPSHPDHPRRPGALATAIADVYRTIDEGIGALVAAAGPDAHVLVVASHGMGPYIGGPQLLPEVLIRLGMSSGSGRAASVRSRVPRPVRHALRPLLPGWADRRLRASAGVPRHPLQFGNTRAAVIPNNRCGAVRVNLRGREPLGQVEPGDEADALVEELRCELLALQDPASGEPVVTRVVTAGEAFGAHHHPDVPDLLVVFRTDLGILETCRSPRVGTVHVPLFKPRLPRTGDHTVESRLWMAGPGIESRWLPDHGDVLDVSPTILDLLGLDAPAGIDGASLLDRDLDAGTVPV